MGKSQKKRTWGERLGDYNFKPTSSQQKRQKTSNEHPKRRNSVHQLRSIPQSTWFKEFSTRRLVLPFEDDPTLVAALEHSESIFDETLDNSSESSSLHEMARTRAEESDKILQSTNLTLTEEYFQDFLDHMEMIGHTPPIESLPKDIQQRILRHDRWYTKIIENVFKAASNHDLVAQDNGSAAIRWQIVNSCATSQDYIQRILLHPHVRPYRVRAELGRHIWKALLSRLATEPLTPESKPAPQAFGTYLLHGSRRPDSTHLQCNLAYCGQACAMGQPRMAGLRKRINDHRREILKICQTSQNIALDPNKEKPMWAYERLTHNDIEKVDYGVLSVIPFLHGDNSYLIHFHCLLALAEAIEVIYLGTQVDRSCARFSIKYGGELGSRLRPSGMPKPEYEPLNIAFPLSQPLFLNGLSYFDWTPEEILVFRDVFKAKDRVYCLSRGVDWNYVEEELRKAGVVKSSTRIKHLYKQMCSNPESGMESERNYRRRKRWSLVCHLKPFLEENGLVKNPEDEYDNYYHIPGLEDGVVTFSQFSAFIRHHGFHGVDWAAQHGQYLNSNWLNDFARVTLPELLSREIWEQLDSAAPAQLLVRGCHHSLYLRKRFNCIVRHYIYRRAQQICSSGEQIIVLGLVMDWDFLLEVWHESMAQLLSDGVPRSKIPARGVNDVLYIWDSTHKGAKIYDCLPRWGYDPALDKLDDTALEAKTHFHGDREDGWETSNNLDAIDFDTSEEDMCVSDVVDDKDESLSNSGSFQNSGDDYVWPCEERRLEILGFRDATQAPDLDLNTDRSPSESRIQITNGARVGPLMGQHCTSSFRVLVRHMADMHRAVFAEENATPNDFWEQLYIAMGTDKWGNPIPNTSPGLQKRFGWVYEYVLTGHMPVEVLRFMDALRQVWNEDGTILRITTHPYTLKAECATSSFMNPDLCPRWVGWMMTKSNAMAKVLQSLPDRYGVEISEIQIKWSYGILIPVLWEEAYRLKLLKMADGSAAEGSSTYRHYYTPKFDNTTGFHEAELTKIEDEKPRSTQFEDERPADIEQHNSKFGESDCESVEIEANHGETELESNQTTEAIKDLISRSYFNGNVSTWAWLHLRYPTQPRRGCNCILVEAVARLDPTFIGNEWLMRLRMRKHLNIKDFVEDKDFSHHGRLIPKRPRSKEILPGSFCLFQPVGGDAADCHLGHKAYQALKNVKDDEGIFIYFNESGINLRARNGTLLHSLHVSVLRGTLLEYYNHERRLQLQAGKTTGLSALSEDAKPGDPKKGTLPSGESLKSRQVAAGGKKPWSTEEAEWFYGKLFIEQSTKFHSLAKTLKELFGIDRTPQSLRAFATQALHWTPRKDPSYAWHPSGKQAYWISRKANKGQLWKDMARDFDVEFRSTRTGEELQLGYEEILKALDPETSEAKKLDWANQNNPLYAKIRSSLQQSNESAPPWKKAEEELLNDCASRGMPWDEIVEELRRGFGFSRTPAAVAYRFQMLKATRKNIPWEKDQVDWLIAERRQRKGGHSREQKTIAQMSVEFEQKFGFPRDVNSINYKVNFLKKKKLVE